MILFEELGYTSPAGSIAAMCRELGNPNRRVITIECNHNTGLAEIACHLLSPSELREAAVENRASDG